MPPRRGPGEGKHPERRLMIVTFVRTAGARDRIYVARDDGSETSWAFPTYGDAPPHDLVHLIAEAELGITPGLWGRVAAGADLGVILEAANRKSGPIAEKFAALGDLRDVIASEEAAAALSTPYAAIPAWIDPGALARAR